MENKEIWVRIDNRLIHGQVIETWIPYCKSKFIVVANDEIYEDPLRQEIMRLAIPANLTILFCSIEKVYNLTENWSEMRGRFT
jgi:PTS system mannose-specific IIB component